MSFDLLDRGGDELAAPEGDGAPFNRIERRPNIPNPKTAAKTAASLIPQPHGGALLSGGVPGKAGGAGRPPSEVRQLAREAYAQRIPVLAAIADGLVAVPLRERCPRCGHDPADEKERTVEKAIERAPSPGEQVRAMAELSKVGMGSPISIDDILHRLVQQMAVLREVLPPAAAEALIDRLGREVWR